MLASEIGAPRWQLTHDRLTDTPLLVSQKQDVLAYIRSTPTTMTDPIVRHLPDLDGRALSHPGDALRHQYAFWGTNAVRFPSLPTKSAKKNGWGGDGRNPNDPSDATMYSNRPLQGTNAQQTQLHQKAQSGYHLASTFMSLVTKAITFSVSWAPQAALPLVVRIDTARLH